MAKPQADQKSSSAATSQTSVLLPGFGPGVGYGMIGGPYGAVGAGYGAPGLAQVRFCILMSLRLFLFYFSQNLLFHLKCLPRMGLTLHSSFLG